MTQEEINKAAQEYKVNETKKDEDLRGWISWSERKPEEGTRGIVIVCDGVGFQLVYMGEINIKMIEAMWKNRTQDMYWIYLPNFKIEGK